MKTHRFHLSKKKIIIFAVLLVIVAVLFYACSRSAAAAKENLIPQVQTTSLKKTSIQDSVSVTGTVQSNNSKNVYTTLTYPVKEVYAKVGDVVKAGQTLAILDTDSLSKDVESAKYSNEYAQKSARLALEKAKADYENALSLYNNNQNADIVSAKAALTAAQQDLNTEKSNYNYAKYQYDNGEISKLALDQAKSKLTAAQNAYDKASTSLTVAQNQAQQNLKALKNAYDAAQAKMNDKSQDVTLAKQQENLRDGVITAPIDGTVTVSNAVVGAVPNGVLFTVEDTNDLIVKTQIKEYDVDQVTVGKKVVIKTDASGDKEIAGVVTKVAPAATVNTVQGTQTTTTSQDNGTVTFAAEVKITQNNPQIRIGMKARLNIILNQKADIYTVPYDAVLHDADGSAYVFEAVKDQNGYKAKKLPVQTGLENDISIEVSGSGIKDGVQIVNNPENISDGSKLKM